MIIVELPTITATRNDNEIITRLDMMNEKIEDLRKDKSVIQILSVKEEEYLAKYTELDYKLTTLEIELPGLDILD
ncbi:5781_t:CDS:2 [Funneliformis caledonium]|uniref:5781_t:CDS:1 n=1 Tax=Funneliformis caledonium TaxID=1117310 RepID=A0A9N9CEK9_9GLOM|nr:5781_t:CDS:2 [Funneliformis caledonium]